MKRVLLTMLLLGAGCAADESANPNFDACETDGDCATGTCYRGFCVSGGMDAGVDAGPPCPAERVCYEGDDETLGNGTCAAGCLADDGATCEGQILPGEETCDGRDEDCDGRVDETFDLGGGDGCGLCGVDCEGGQTCCDDGSGSFECARLETSADHCGGCGMRCPLGQSCCGGFPCVDTDTDPSNCGGCGIECPAGRMCCGGRCIDPDYSNDHCGGCGVQTCEGTAASTCCPSDIDPSPDCRAEDECLQCATECTGGQACCGGDCLDVSDDPLNCGGCGVTCGADERCCGGTCTALDDACSACGDDCGDTEQCCAEMCITRRDETNCQGCGVECDPDEVCCDSGCSNTDTDEMNCGGCGMPACGASQECTNGHCCPVGQRWCPGPERCIDVSSNDDHCGSCGTRCPVFTGCRDGRCVALG